MFFSNFKSHIWTCGFICKARPYSCVKLSNASPQVKQMAAVLLRRLLSSSFEEVYPSLTIDVQTAIKTELLAGIQSECSSNIRKKVCDIAAELSRNLIGELTLVLRMSRTKWHRCELMPCFYPKTMTATISGQRSSSSCSIRWTLKTSASGKQRCTFSGA